MTNKTKVTKQYRNCLFELIWDGIEDLNTKMTSNLTFEIPTETLESFQQSLATWRRILTRYIDDARDILEIETVSKKTVEKKPRKIRQAAAKKQAVCCAKKKTPRPKARRKG